MLYLLVINFVINLLQKIITSVSKIITSGFVVDLGAQEEFDNNYWCFVKLSKEHAIVAQCQLWL